VPQNSHRSTTKSSPLSSFSSRSAFFRFLFALPCCKARPRIRKAWPCETGESFPTKKLDPPTFWVCLNLDRTDRIEIRSFDLATSLRYSKPNGGCLFNSSSRCVSSFTRHCLHATRRARVASLCCRIREKEKPKRVHKRLMRKFFESRNIKVKNISLD